MAAVAHLHLDPLGGIAGDMFLAALLDLRPELAEGTFAAMRAAGLPDDWRTELVAHDDGRLTGRRVVIEGPHGHAGHGHVGQGPGRFREIRAHLAAAPLAPAVRSRAIGILTLLAEAEAAVHGVAVDEVHFHELADWDSVADVVGAAWLIETLGPSSVSTAPLPLGGGRVASAHGALPVPAPATARLLEGLPVLDDGIAGERVTPTGAAIVRHLQPAARLPDGPWRLAGTGNGFGSRRLPGLSNLLRVLVFEAAGAGRIDERVAVIAFEVDDQSPEELALALDALRGDPGVLDAVQMPAIGKKGRLAVHIQVLARPERLDAVIARCFVETTTIGLRWRLEARAALAREQLAVATPAGPVGVKLVTRPDGTRTAKAEIADLAPGPGGQAARARRRREIEADALAEKEGEPDAPAD